MSAGRTPGQRKANVGEPDVVLEDFSKSAYETTGAPRRKVKVKVKFEQFLKHKQSSRSPLLNEKNEQGNEGKMSSSATLQSTPRKEGVGTTSYNA